MSGDIHGDIVGNRNWYRTSRFLDFTEFQPFDGNVDEFRALVTATEWDDYSDVIVEKMWVIPVCRYLQQLFRIDQRSYSTGTNPTLAELTEDFKNAVALTCDRWIRNEHEVFGREGVPGAGSVNWDQKIPTRAAAILERYRQGGGQVGRS